MVTLLNNKRVKVVDRLRIYPEWTNEWLLTLEDGSKIRGFSVGDNEYQEF